MDRGLNAPNGKWLVEKITTSLPAISKGRSLFMSRDAHERRVRRRADNRGRLQALNNEDFVKELLALLELVGKGVEFIARVENSGTNELLTGIASVLKAAKTACRRDPVPKQELWTRIRSLFNESFDRHLWRRGIITLSGDPKLVEQFQADSTVFWEEVDRRFRPRRR